MGSRGLRHFVVPDGPSPVAHWDSAHLALLCLFLMLAFSRAYRQSWLGFSFYVARLLVCTPFDAGSSGTISSSDCIQTTFILSAFKQNPPWNKRRWFIKASFIPPRIVWDRLAAENQT
jgi:hypothetical protein